jgi:nucleotide-binding universal stress UspA family protein
MLQHILVGLDGSPLAETILAYVSTLAKRLGTDVTLLNVVHLSEDMQREEISRVLQPSLEQAKTRAQAYVRRVAQRLNEAGITTHSRVVMGEAATEVVRYAQQEHMDLIALATHGRSGLQRWFYGSVADKVLHTAHTPLLLIRPVEPQELPPQDLSAIVVPLDGSPLAEGALPVAAAMATRCNAPLILLRVIEIVSIAFADPTGMAGTNYQPLLDSLQHAADNYLNALAGSLRSKGVHVQTATPLGAPAEKIVEYAREHPGSLVVMSTHGRSGLTSVMLGSVARRVVLQGNAPTLVVRPTSQH